MAVQVSASTVLTQAKDAPAQHAHSKDAGEFSLSQDWRRVALSKKPDFSTLDTPIWIPGEKIDPAMECAFKHLSNNVLLPK
jgi:hypothetical protein